MVLYADLHIHSRYSRAVSINSTLENLAAGADVKGLGLLGTGDFTHPKWIAEIKNKLVEIEGEPGFFKLNSGNAKCKFMLTVEVATFDSTKRVHHILHAPSIEVAVQINDLLDKRGTLSADGRPMLGKTTCAEIVEIAKGVSKKVEIVAAHAWTPYFGVLGDKSGYQSVQEAYGDKAHEVLGIETGMSSDPAMNWRVSSLDKYAIMSNSDCHSPHAHRIGRECNAFDESCNSFDKLFDAVRKQDEKRFLFTVETNPSYGKYHLDGHRDCHFSCAPSETKKLAGVCPVCKRKLTIGVENRVEALADPLRPIGFKRAVGAIPFKTVLPLAELIASVIGGTAYSVKVQAEHAKLVQKLGSEFAVLFDATPVQLAAITSPQISGAILLNRDGNIKVVPGYDGEYGVLQLPERLVTAVKRAKRSPVDKIVNTTSEDNQKGLDEF